MNRAVPSPALLQMSVPGQEGRFHPRRRAGPSPQLRESGRKFKIAYVRPLFDHLVGGNRKSLRHGDAKRPSSLDINY